MTVKTEDLLSEITEALYQKKAVLLTGSTGVGKTYLAKRISEQLSKSEYSCFPSSEDQRVNVEIISCHNKEYQEAMETLGIKQMILQGPPGTSKTYSAKAFLKYMAHNCSDEELADIQIADYSNEDKYCAKLFKTDVFMEEEGLSNPGKYISGSIKPDLILTDRESGETVVFDVKYKDYTNGDSRNDRLQLLAYSMMMNANNVGIILPTHVDVEIFDARRINSMENRIVKYHQMLLGIMKDNPTIADYIKDNTFEKKE